MKRTGIKWLGAVAGLIGIAVALAGCSQGYVSAGSQSAVNSGGAATATPAATGPSSRSNIVYQQQPLNSTISGNTVTLAMARVAQQANSHFNVNISGNLETFMAYQLDGKYYVRADICPPCGSRSFHLQNGKLICDSCGTVFNATSGVPVSGACVAYPKALVSYTTDGANMVMNMSDLSTAFQKTINRQGLN